METRHIGTGKILGLAVLALLIGVALVVVYSARSTQPAANGSSGAVAKDGPAGLTRTSEGGSVTVDVTWENPSEVGAAPVRFRVAMNTHSVELDQYDLGKLAVLSNDSGIEETPEEWDAPAGGHHRAGELVFSASKDEQPIVGPETKAIKLVIRDLAGVGERDFQWEVARKS